MAQLVAALGEALPTKFRPCVPDPRDGLIHISIGYAAGEPVPTPGQPTTALCGPGMIIDGASIVPNFVICTSCWQDFLNRSPLAKTAAAL